MERNRFLLDTHVFIWAMEEDKYLSQGIRDKLIDPGNKIFVSTATVWEIVIKRSLKKLKANFDIASSIEEAGLDLLSIELPHVLGVGTLPLYHKDPFDRLLISQTKVENLTLMTADEKIWEYDLSLVKV